MKASIFTVTLVPGREGPVFIGQELVHILACPQCKGDLALHEHQDGLICGRCDLSCQLSGHAGRRRYRDILKGAICLRLPTGGYHGR